jgi:hypothetical protein
MKTYLGKSKQEWYFTHKIAFSHQYLVWLTIPLLLTCLTKIVLLITSNGEPLGIWRLLILPITFALIWHIYTGFRCMCVCKQSGIDYNKPWSEAWMNLLENKGHEKDVFVRK